MSVLSVKLKTTPEANLSVDGNSYSELYTVIVDKIYDNPLEILEDDRIPQLRGRHKHDGSVEVTRVSAPSPTGSRLVFEITVDYEKIEDDREEGEASSFAGGLSNFDPLAEKPVVQESSFEYTEYITQDFSNEKKKIESTAGEPYDPFPVKRRGLQFTISYNKSNFNMADHLHKIGSINKVAVGFPSYIQFSKGELKLHDLGGTKKIDEDGSPYYEIVSTWRVMAGGDGWQKKLENRGFYKKDGDNLVPILDKNKDPVTTARRLDENGAELATGADPVFLDLELIPEVLFRTLVV